MSASTAGVSHTSLGMFGPGPGRSCYNVFIDGQVYSPSGGSYVEWEISATNCVG
jgi:hypothetical protein